MPTRAVRRWSTSELPALDIRPSSVAALRSRLVAVSASVASASGTLTLLRERALERCATLTNPGIATIARTTTITSAKISSGRALAPTLANGEARCSLR